MTTTQTTRCECGETEPHAPARFIGPGVDGIDSTTRTCPGVVSDARGNLAGMTTPTTIPEAQTYITIPEAAEALEVAPWVVARWAGGSELQAVRHGGAVLVREYDVQALGAPVGEGPDDTGRDWRDVTLPEVEQAAVALGVDPFALAAVLPSLAPAALRARTRETAPEVADALDRGEVETAARALLGLLDRPEV